MLSHYDSTAISGHDGTVTMGVDESRQDLIILYSNSVQINRVWKVPLQEQHEVTRCCLRGLPAALANLKYADGFGRAEMVEC